MFLYPIVILFVLSFNIEAKSWDRTQTVIHRVGEYLKSHPQLLAVDTKWLQNSNKIGSGYDLISGSPVCYTGECQMEGFRQSLFNLDITQEPAGSCTDKLIPKNVGIQCLSSTQLTANTESISTLEQLQESIKKGLEVGGSVGAYGNSFSYTHSKETRSMIDTMIQSNSTIYFTRATISWVRLTAFVPFLKLSDQFVYVIKKMPCCRKTVDVENYIKKNVFNYFGTMYVNDLLLGGIAQQKIVVSDENRKKLASNGFSNSNEGEFKVAAGAVFSASAKLKVTDQSDQTKVNAFTKYSQQSSVTTLGGDPVLQSIEEWSKTIPSNPTIIRFGIEPIVDLLTSERFPNDKNIAKKRALVKYAQEKYTGIVSCYNDCRNRGTCEPTGYFGFGKCRCNISWSGMDCSIDASVASGTWALSTKKNSNSQLSCSIGGSPIRRTFGLYAGTHTFGTWAFYICPVLEKNILKGPKFTVCGIWFMEMFVECGATDFRHSACPAGYVKYTEKYIPDHRVKNGEGKNGFPLVTCLKEDPNISDMGGTICGFHNGITVETQVLCNGRNLRSDDCPPGYWKMSMSEMKSEVDKTSITILPMKFCVKH